MSEANLPNEANNCWEYWQCDPAIRERCEAFTMDWGRKCHLLAPGICPRLKRDYEFCWQCPWCQIIDPKFCQRGRTLSDENKKKRKRHPTPC